MRRLRLLAPALLLLVATLAVAWAGANLPPPLLLFRYGLPSSQGPTGRVARVEGIDFVEISPGYFRMGSRYLVDHPGGAPAVPGDVAGRLARPIGVRVGERPVPSEEMPVHWVEFPHGFWIARTEVTREQYGDEHGRPKQGRPVTWREADAFCRDLAARAGLPIRLFRVLRGQAYGSNSLVDLFDPYDDRSASRGYGNGAARSRYLGVRPAFSLVPDQERLLEPYLVEGGRRDRE